MKLTLRKSESTAVPTRTLSSIRIYQMKAKQTIAGQQQQLTKWFISNGLNYRDVNIPRLQLLSRAQQIIKDNIKNPKYINTLFLQQPSVISLIQQCQSLIDISFVLAKHLQLKVNVKQIDYADPILSMAKSRTQLILRQNQNRLESVLGVSEVQSYIQQKRRVPQSLYIVDPYQRQQMENEAISIFNYLLKPIFEKKNLTNVADCLDPMIYWFVIIKDQTPQKQNTLMEIIRKIDAYLWIKKSSSNLNLIRMFNYILNLLSLKCLRDESFSPHTLAPVLLKLKGIPFEQLITNWISTQDKKTISKSIQNIFRNSLNSGCTIFCFQIIDSFSKYLYKMRNFDTLYHLFNSFIRKQYLSIKLPNGSFVKAYMNILMMYAIGFINRDRLDGQTQVDRLAVNLSELVCRKRFTFQDCYSQIIKFFRIYENRFQFLSSTCKKLVTNLQITYKVTYPITTLHQQVGNRIFKQFSADYNENDIYSLQRSHRYAGILNLGNTCYMNSFMQALYMTKKFKSLVIKAQDEGIVPTNHPIFQALIKLFSELNQNSAKLQQVQPNYFKNQTPEPFKSSWQQHDSGQFGRMYLDFVTSELKDTQLAQKINKLFTHQIISKVICKGCNQQRDKKEKQFDFILNVDQNSTDVITVSDLLKKYLKGYELDSNNKLYCPHCRDDKTALVIKQPAELAEHLVATISIFKYDKNGSSKIAKALNFQFTLNFKNIIPKIVKQDEIYDLYAFILHIGTGVQRGHYQCFARNLQQNPMLWYKFDDSYVTQQEINQIQDFHFGQNQTPYILFYSSSNKSRKILLSS